MTGRKSEPVISISIPSCSSGNIRSRPPLRAGTPPLFYTLSTVTRAPVNPVNCQTDHMVPTRIHVQRATLANRLSRDRFDHLGKDGLRRRRWNLVRQRDGLNLLHLFCSARKQVFRHGDNDGMSFYGTTHCFRVTALITGSCTPEPAGLSVIGAGYRFLFFFCSFKNRRSWSERKFLHGAQSLRPGPRYR